MSTATARLKTDLHALRKDFPILQRTVHGKPLIYLDSTATSQKPEVVLNTLDHYYRHYNANVHRGVYQISEEATAKYEEGRAKVARFIHSPSACEIIFVRNTTEAINLVAYSWGRANIRAGDVIILTEMEHHSNLIPWQLLAREKGAHLRFLEVDEAGFLRLDKLDTLLTERVKLVALTHMSNVLGTINPVKEIIRQAHQIGAITLVDAAQSVPHLPVDVQELDCDFLAFSGHKMVGPTGIGVLYGKQALLEAMPPFLGGGEMIKDVTLYDATWNDLPWKFEAGTPSIAEGIALGAAVDYLEGIGMETLQRHEQELVAYAMEQLQSVPEITVYGPPPSSRGGVIAFTLADIHPHDIAAVLDQEGIAIRAGHHCAKPLHKKLGVVATARASFYLYNTREEVDHLVTALQKTLQLFKG